jgi:glycosyltransferase involved in cell wall biosynthesis
LRILILSREYAPDDIGGGIGSHLAGFAPALVARGHEVHVLSCVPAQNVRDFIQDGVMVHRRGVPRLPGLGRSIGSHSAAIRVRTALGCLLQARRLGFEPDVVHMPDWMAEGLFVAWMGRWPTVANLATPLHMTARHNGAPLTWDIRFGDALERLSVRGATRVATTSALLAGDLAAWLGSRPVAIVPPPVDGAMWGGLPAAGDAPPVVLAVGRIEPRKAADVLVEAGARLRATVPDLELVFVGRDSGLMDGRPYGDLVRQRAEELQVPCRFLGQQDRAALPEIYAGARVVAVPSRYDSFSVTALEGMAAGRPTICSTTTGAGELLGDHQSLLVPPEDPGALADAIAPFLVDPGLATTTGRAVQAIVRERCAPARIAEIREGLYEDAVEAHRRRPSRWRRA